MRKIGLIWGMTVLLLGAQAILLPDLEAERQGDQGCSNRGFVRRLAEVPRVNGTWLLLAQYNVAGGSFEETCSYNRNVDRQFRLLNELFSATSFDNWACTGLQFDGSGFLVTYAIQTDPDDVDSFLPGGSYFEEVESGAVLAAAQRTGNFEIDTLEFTADGEPTVRATPTPTPTPTPSPTPSPIPSPTPSPSPTPGPPGTPSPSPQGSPSPSPQGSPSPSPQGSPSPSPQGSPSPSPQGSPSPPPQGSGTPTPTPSQSPKPTPTAAFNLCDKDFTESSNEGIASGLAYQVDVQYRGPGLENCDTYDQTFDETSRSLLAENSGNAQGEWSPLTVETNGDATTEERFAVFAFSRQAQGRTRVGYEAVSNDDDFLTRVDNYIRGSFAEDLRARGFDVDSVGLESAAATGAGLDRSSVSGGVIVAFILGGCILIFILIVNIIWYLNNKEKRKLLEEEEAAQQQANIGVSEDPVLSVQTSVAQHPESTTEISVDGGQGSGFEARDEGTA